MEDKKLHIGLFCDSFYPMVDGVIQVVDNYARELGKFCDVTVFVPKARKKYTGEFPYKVVRSKIMKVFFLDYDLSLPRLDKKFMRQLNNSNLDIVHIHSPFTIGKIGLKYAQKHKIPCVATLHSQFKKDFYRATHSKMLTKFMLKKIMSVFNQCTELWTMNQKCVDLSREYGYVGKTYIMPNATNLKNDFDLDKENVKIELQDKYFIKSNEKILLSIGRLNKLKNIDFSIDVCSKLKEKNFPFKMILVGKGVDENYFKDLVKSKNLNDKIIFAGKVVDPIEKAKLFLASDLHIFPSEYDTDGIVRIEAAAFGLPSICVKDSFPASTIKNDINGYVCEKDSTMFADKIIEIFKDKQKYNQVCENTYKDLYLSWPAVINKAYNRYIKLIEQNKK